MWLSGKLSKHGKSIRILLKFHAKIGQGWGCRELPRHARTGKNCLKDMPGITLDVQIPPGDIVQVSSSVFSESQEYPGDASGVPGKIPKRSRDPKR